MRTLDTINAALDRLYVAFSGVPRPAAVQGCSHCFTESEAAALLVPVPLRDLPPESLRPYTASVMSTVGEVADFRYFLPRMLEVACTGASAWLRLGWIGGPLRIAAWSTWAPGEQVAIRDLLHACWAAALAQHSGYENADSMLDSIGNAEDDLTPYLEEWTRTIHVPAAAAGLRSLLWHSSRPIELESPGPGTPHDDHNAQFVRWLYGAKLRCALDAALAGATAVDARQSLADIIGFLKHYA